MNTVGGTKIVGCKSYLTQGGFKIQSKINKEKQNNLSSTPEGPVYSSRNNIYIYESMLYILFIIQFLKLKNLLSMFQISTNKSFQLLQFSLKNSTIICLINSLLTSTVFFTFLNAAMNILHTSD